MSTQVDGPEGWPGGFERLHAGPGGRRRASWVARDRTRPDRQVVVEMPRWPQLAHHARLQIHGDLTEGLGRLGTLRQDGLPRTLHLGSPDEQGRFALVREHVEGRTLAEILGSIDLSVSGRLESLLEVIEQVCERLARLHQRGVVHGDVTPTNILLGEGSSRGQVFLLGLLWAQSERTREAETTAPEQTFEPPRAATDQWQVAELLRHTLEDEGRRLPHMPAALRVALNRAREVAVARRFPSIEHFAAALAAVRAELFPGTPPARPDEPTQGPIEVSPRRDPPPRPAPAIPAPEPLDAASLAPTIETASIRGPDSISPALEVRLPALKRRAEVPEGVPDDTDDLMRSIRSRRWPWVFIGVCTALAAALGWFLAAPKTTAPPGSRAAAPPRLEATRDAGLSAPLRTPGGTDAGPVDSAAVIAAGEASSAAPARGVAPQTGDKASSAPRTAGLKSPALSCTSAHPRGCRGRAQQALRAGQKRSARRLYERGCDGRDPLACAALAKMWKRGVGGPQRQRTAIAFARRACALGHSPSCRGP